MNINTKVGKKKMSEETQEETQTPEQGQEEKPEKNQTPDQETNKGQERSEESEKTEKSKEFQTIDAQKRRWREKAEGLEKELNKVKSEQSKLEKKSTPKSSDDKSLWQAKVDFLLQNRNKNYSEDEFDHIANVASNKGVSLSEAAKKEDDYIQYRRKKVAETKQTPTPSSSGSGSFTPEITSDMNQEQMDKALKQAFEKAERGESEGV